MKKPAEAQDILFEIGTEELPATNLAEIFCESDAGPNVLESKLRHILETYRLSFGSCRVWATPRRLVFIVEGAASAQAEKENLIKLIAHQEAYSAEGRPTEKLLTILKHRKVGLSDTVISQISGKDFVFIKNNEPVRKTASVLPELFETLVKSLAFPKNMRWDSSGVIFPRPIRSALCLYGQASIRMKVGAVRSSGSTLIFSRGKRIRVPVKDAASYFKALEKNGVILDPESRKDKIRAILDKLSHSASGKLYEDPFLLNEVNFLVENPNGLVAPFGEEFLKLPLEVLTVSMARKQRIFGLLDKNGKVLPRLLAIVDGKISDKERKTISKNYEYILHAKLQDSLFFYKEDLKLKLEDKRRDLKGLVFLKDAGSMLDKSERLERLSKTLGHELELSGAEEKALERAAHLSKSDLLTHMVGEFPELQGVIGRYYAIENGESRETALAIGEQYLPRTVHDKLPQTKMGAVLSLVDKCDLVTASFGMGLEPSSSLDPYGLRRSVSAVLKIIVELRLNFSLKKLLAENQKELGSFVLAEKQKDLPARLDAFFKDRFKALMVDRGFSGDLVDAVVTTGFERPYETFLRLEALSQFSGEANFSQASKVVERTSNILRGNKEPLPETINPELFGEPLEREVFKKYQECESAIRTAQTARDFRLATNLYADAFFAILGEFFEKVFINAEDLNVRKNRLALLKVIKDLYTKNIADLSKIRPK